jgi:hypothetical protein
MAAAVMAGRHTGPFNGIAPTGRPIAHKQVHIFTIADGQISRLRAIRDDLGLLLARLAAGRLSQPALSACMSRFITAPASWRAWS